MYYFFIAIPSHIYLPRSCCANHPCIVMGVPRIRAATLQSVRNLANSVRDRSGRDVIGERIRPCFRCPALPPSQREPRGDTGGRFYERGAVLRRALRIPQAIPTLGRQVTWLHINACNIPLPSSRFSMGRPTLRDGCTPGSLTCA